MIKVWLSQDRDGNFVSDDEDGEDEEDEDEEEVEEEEEEEEEEDVDGSLEKQVQNGVAGLGKDNDGEHIYISVKGTV